KIFFYPAPAQPSISTIARSLEVDFQKLQPANKKKVLIKMKKKWQDNLALIYDQTLETKSWVGSDIWGFFDRSVKDQCIKKSCRNILVILTDGYLFYEGNKIEKVKGDSTFYSYILPKTLKDSKSNLILSRNDLQELEVLLLEVNPYDQKDYSRIESILSSWFNGMGIQYYSIHQTDLPCNTEIFIDNFLDH
ncbi:MAG: hypothetical protein WCQ86_07105, partial [Bacteroidaceae bacterium]